MRFAELAATSAQVAATSSRLEKIRRLADLLARLEPDEIEPTVAYLSGATRQGRIGVGYAAIRSASDTPPAESPSLEIRELDAAFASLAGLSGKGSAGERARILRSLFSRATRDEQDFLARLLHGELRQGALEGVLLEAIARASSVDAARVRRAAMMAGELGPVARAAFASGADRARRLRGPAHAAGAADARRIRGQRRRRDCPARRRGRSSTKWTARASRFTRTETTSRSSRGR